MARLAVADAGRQVVQHRIGWPGASASNAAVTQWEQQGGTLPNVEHLMKIAQETGVFFEWLATGRGPCRPDEGELTPAVVVSEYAKDDFETHALLHLRRLSVPRKKTAIEILEILSR